MQPTVISRATIFNRAITVHFEERKIIVTGIYLTHEILCHRNYSMRRIRLLPANVNRKPKKILECRGSRICVCARAHVPVWFQKNPYRVRTVTLEAYVYRVHNRGTHRGQIRALLSAYTYLCEENIVCKKSDIAANQEKNILSSRMNRVLPSSSYSVQRGKRVSVRNLGEETSYIASSMRHGWSNRL